MKNSNSYLLSEKISFIGLKRTVSFLKEFISSKLQTMRTKIIIKNFR